MGDPIEDIVEVGLRRAGIAFTRDGEADLPLDFYLPEFGVYIECKQFSTPRKADQIEGVDNVIVIQGKTAAKLFADAISHYI